MFTNKTDYSGVHDKMALDYFQAEGVVMPNGMVSAASRRSIELERAVMSTLSFIWSLKMGSFGRFAPLDFWAFRDNKFVSVMELKTHAHGIDKYGTTQLNLRKWGWMKLYQDLGVKVIYLKLFLGDLYYIDFANIKTTDAVRIGGCHKAFKSVTDVEPVIDIPVDELKFVCQVMTRSEYDALSEQERKPKSVEGKYMNAAYKKQKAKWHGKSGDRRF